MEVADSLGARRSTPESGQDYEQLCASRVTRIMSVFADAGRSRKSRRQGPVSAAGIPASTSWSSAGWAALRIDRSDAVGNSWSAQ